MGEVYRARDGKLGRDVAIKVLPEAFASDAERLARFRREAKVLASLNHPHIAAIYGLEESGGVEALVLELVEGETLAERLAAGPLPVEESLAIARKIAVALEAAHEKGIVHRDLKPANVRLTPSGDVKVLDFGLAKACGEDPSRPDVSTSPTLTAAATRSGIAIGTASYMSPEQARGKAVDKRADVWAFGAVLYEMLTGNRPFPGETISDTLASVLKTEPDWSALPASTPRAVRRLLRRCLRKDPAQRLRDIGDARIELDEVGPDAEDTAVQGPGATAGHRPALLLGFILLGIAVGALAASLLARRSSPGSEGDAGTPMRFVPVTNFSGMETQPSLSPDGRSVAFVSNRDGVQDIWVGLIGGGRLVRITNDPAAESHPQWSPDGTRIAYAKLKESGFSDIWEVPALGGAPRRIVVDASEPAWSPDGRSLAYTNLMTDLIWTCDASGGNARAVTTPGPISRTHRQPAFSHDGRRLAYVQRQSGPYGEIAVVDLATGSSRTVTADFVLAFSPAWSTDEAFLYFASSRGGTGNIWKIPAASGPARQISAGQGDDLDISLSADGKRLVFSTYRQNINIGLADLGAKGEKPGLKWLTSDASRGELAPAFSPDGSRIAFFSNRKGVEKEGIWVMDVDGSNATPLVVDSFQNVMPRWYPDGRSLLFRSSDARLGRSGDRYRRAAISGGPPEVLASEPLGLRVDVDSQERILGTDAEGHLLLFDPKSRQKRILQDCRGSSPRFSPDGRKIAYMGPAGRPESGLWVYDFQAAPRQIFAGWLVGYSWAGSEEFVFAEGKPDLTQVFWRIRSDGTDRRPIPLSVPFGGTAWEFLSVTNFDVSRDGRRIVIQAREQSQADIGMIENVK